ncbi:phosphate acyltransferase PlsX [Thermophilibacter provencensis]|uniref:Phosphate acyltransferase n=2 Tax=Thermophilibacter provencensis TaxID=1852386 RepID=A0A921KJX0_9ACTN|nr:phosphate acyltransferase PlsX [Thermophilibacter provencensis]MBM6814793.1 phosphate acyltransferase PlsX [Olsenella uli]HJF44332.1 phosphate acyltransferase PlsX [Thermophilibacter provencensis]
MTTICVDVMGADKEPPVLLEGVEAALAADPELEVLVAGAADVVEPFAASHDRARALVTTEVIAMSEHPASAVRVKKDASIVRAAAAVRAGEADGLFSAGSTGAVLTAATFGVGRIKGIKRPALSLPFPGISGKPTVFLDMGANADVKPEVLVQFAHMGRAYSRAILGVDEPRVGLLCNGSEDTKGSEMALAYHAALEAGDCGFAGNAEGTDLLAGTFDVIVADGFTGNVALKSIEGTGKFVIKRLKAAMGASLGNKIGMALLAKSLKSLAAEMSGDEYGGAILLGLRAPVVKGHGATSARAVCQGTLAAAAAVRAGLTDKIAAACDIAG